MVPVHDDEKDTRKRSHQFDQFAARAILLLLVDGGGAYLRVHLMWL